jgi:hypothetical protein
MSAKVTRLVVNNLRNNMFPALPVDVQKMFPLVNDPYATVPNSQVPNIMPGEYTDWSSNAGMILITVHSAGELESMTRVYRHLVMYIDIWVSAGQSPNVEGRRIVDILYEYVQRFMQENNWSGSLISIQRSYEIERSEVMFEPTNKIYHISNQYRVEAITSAGWY